MCNRVWWVCENFRSPNENGGKDPIFAMFKRIGLCVISLKTVCFCFNVNGIARFGDLNLFS
jgi:hypothetical protein